MANAPGTPWCGPTLQVPAAPWVARTVSRHQVPKESNSWGPGASEQSLVLGSRSGFESRLRLAPAGASVFCL